MMQKCYVGLLPNYNLTQSRKMGQVTLIFVKWLVQNAVFLARPALVLGMHSLLCPH